MIIEDRGLKITIEVIDVIRFLIVSSVQVIIRGHGTYWQFSGQAHNITVLVPLRVLQDLKCSDVLIVIIEGFKTVATECAVIGHVLRCQWTIYIQYPFSHVAGHVVESEVVGRIESNLHGDVCLVIQPSTRSHVVSTASLVVGQHISTVVLFRAAHRTAVPSILIPLYGPIIHAVADVSVGGIFPLCLRRESVFGKK